GGGGSGRSAGGLIQCGMRSAECGIEVLGSCRTTRVEKLRTPHSALRFPPHMDLGLAGRVALVCGSTKGLGRAVAKALAQEGARVAINGRHQDSVERVAQQLEAETSRTVVPLVADVGTPAEAEGMVERVARELGRLDILFCNASGPPAAPFSHQTADAFQRAVEVNLLSTVHLARAAVPVMRKVQWGRIICLAS